MPIMIAAPLEAGRKWRKEEVPGGIVLLAAVSMLKQMQQWVTKQLQRRLLQHPPPRHEP